MSIELSMKSDGLNTISSYSVSTCSDLKIQADAR